MGKETTCSSSTDTVACFISYSNGESVLDIEEGRAASIKIKIWLFFSISQQGVSADIIQKVCLLVVSLVDIPPHTVCTILTVLSKQNLKQEWQNSPAGTRQTDSKNLVWFGEIERKLAKLSKATFTYRSSP